MGKNHEAQTISGEEKQPIEILTVAQDSHLDHEPQEASQMTSNSREDEKISDDQINHNEDEQVNYSSKRSSSRSSLTIKGTRKESNGETDF